MLPADQRLGSHQRPIGQPQLGLIINAQLVGRDRLAQFTFQHQPLEGDGVHLPVVEGPAVSPELLGAVQGGIGVLQQFGEVSAVVRVQGDPDGHGHAQAVAGHDERPLKSRQQPFGRPQRPVLADLRQQQHETVAAQPADGIFRPKQGLEAGRDLHQQGVTGYVTQRVVDFLESVEVQKQYRHFPSVAARQGQSQFCPLRQQRPVGQVGQGIVIGQVLDALFGLLAHADVAGVADGADDPIVHPHGRFVGFEPAPRLAGSVDHLFRLLRPAAGQHLPVIGHVAPGQVGGPDIQIGFADQPLGRIEPTSASERRVDRQKPAFRIFEPDQEGKIVQQSALVFQIGAQLFLRLLARGDVRHHRQHVRPGFPAGQKPGRD